MTKKRIRQMNSALRRRLTGRPAADWLPQGEPFARRLETEGYMQRFVPLFQGRRLRCADVLALCDEVRAVVKEKTGYDLEKEIRVVKA